MISTLGKTTLMALFSGGKDSTFAIYYALSQGWIIKNLITIEPKKDSIYWHYPNIEWTKLQAEAMGMSLTKIYEEGYDGMGSLEEALKELKKEDEIVGIVSGVIYSDFQRKVLIKICKKVGLKLITPLWMKNPLMILDKIVKCGIHAIIVSVAAQGLDEEWLGMEINYDTISKLIEKNKKYGISLCGEGGEYETFVYDAPFFKKRVKINRYEKIWMKDSGILKIKDAELVGK